MPSRGTLLWKHQAFFWSRGERLLAAWSDHCAERNQLGDAGVARLPSGRRSIKIVHCPEKSRRKNCECGVIIGPRHGNGVSSEKKSSGVSLILAFQPEGIYHLPPGCFRTPSSWAHWGRTVGIHEAALAHLLREATAKFTATVLFHAPLALRCNGGYSRKILCLWRDRGFARRPYSLHP